MGQFNDEIRQRLMHFDGILDGHEHLLAQAIGTPVPEELLFPGQIEQRHGFARSQDPFRTARGAATALERLVRQMAIGAGLPVVVR